MSAALDENKYNIIIADYKLPKFGGLKALKLKNGKDIDIPLLMVSGVMKEDIAVEVMRAGAQDFITKGKLMRLSAAVDRELEEMDVHKERQKAEKALQRTNKMITDVLEISVMLL